MKKRKENKLQVFINGSWKYVFCYNQYCELITTETKRKGLSGSGLSFFSNKFGNHQFRVV